MRRDQEHGFTLIELLIVVAIIAILAAIALPNFLEAQTRSRVSRVKADFRALAIGIEAYSVDCGHYPWRDDVKSGLPAQYWSIGYRLGYLTTPVAYTTSVSMVDPFIEKGTEGGYHDNWSRNQYNYRSYEARTFNLPYRAWALNSLGPDRLKQQGLKIETYARHTTTDTVIYDPTNGTVSQGDISWTGGDTRYHNR